MNMSTMGETPTGGETFVAPQPPVVEDIRDVQDSVVDRYGSGIPPADTTPKREPGVLYDTLPSDFQPPATIPAEMTAAQRFDALSKNTRMSSEMRGHETRKRMNESAKRLSDKLFGPAVKKLKEIGQGIGRGVDVTLGLPKTVAEIAGTGMEAGADFIDNKVNQYTDASVKFVDRVNTKKMNLIDRVKNIKDSTTTKINTLTKKGAILGLKAFVPAQDMMLEMSQMSDSFREWRASRYELKAIRKFNETEVRRGVHQKSIEKGEKMDADEYISNKTKQDVINQILLQKLQRNVVGNENQYKISIAKSQEMYETSKESRHRKAEKYTTFRQRIAHIEASLPRSERVQQLKKAA